MHKVPRSIPVNNGRGNVHACFQLLYAPPLKFMFSDRSDQSGWSPSAMSVTLPTLLPSTQSSLTCQSG